MKIFTLIASVLLALISNAQPYQYVYNNPTDSSYNSYLVFIPDGKPKGLIVRDYSRLPDAERKPRFQFKNLAVNDGYVYLITCSSNNFPELFFFDEPMERLDSMIAQVVEEYQVPKDKLFIGGISASGTRAMRFAAFCHSGKSKFGTKFHGVFACDSPLDMERFYNSAKNIRERNHPKGMNEEAQWMEKKFKEIGNPNDNYDQYANSSVVLKSDTSLDRLKVYQGLPVRLYFEADMNWWLLERNANYEDINAVDHVSFAQKMSYLGNSR